MSRALCYHSKYVPRIKFDLNLQLISKRLPGHLQSDCTHFTWTKEKNGTCSIKGNKVSLSDLVFGNDESSVCGLVDDNISHIEWNENGWANGCTFMGPSLDIATTGGHHECYAICASNQGKCLK